MPGQQAWRGPGLAPQARAGQLNAYELPLVRRSEGFVSSHLAFSLLDLASDVPGARDGWNLICGVLRGKAWHPAPALLDEVVRLGREHQQEVGSVVGSQVPAAAERLLSGALSHPANQGVLAPFLADPWHSYRQPFDLIASAAQADRQAKSSGGPENGDFDNWRRKRDSNPRYPYEYCGFQDRRLKPLGHSSDSQCSEAGAAPQWRALCRRSRSGGQCIS